MYFLSFLAAPSIGFFSCVCCCLGSWTFVSSWKQKSVFSSLIGRRIVSDTKFAIPGPHGRIGDTAPSVWERVRWD